RRHGTQAQPRVRTCRRAPTGTRARPAEERRRPSAAGHGSTAGLSVSPQQVLRRSGWGANGSDDDAARGQPGPGVDLLGAVLPHLEVQVRAGGLTAVADLGDLLAALDLLHGLHRE